MVSPRGARPQPPGPKALLSIRRYLISGKYMMPSGLISTSSTTTGCSNIFCASALKGASLKPWNERDQSTCSELAVGKGSSSRPSLSERVSTSVAGRAALREAEVAGRGDAVVFDAVAAGAGTGVDFEVVAVAVVAIRFGVYTGFAGAAACVGVVADFVVVVVLAGGAAYLG